MPRLSTCPYQLCPDFLGTWVSGEAQTLKGLGQAAVWVEFLQWCLKAQ